MTIVRVDGSRKVRLEQCDPDDTGALRDKRDAQVLFKTERDRIIRFQERLYAERAQTLLVVFQAIDTGGKDGTIRNVFKGVNPQGCRVWSFGVPSEEEAAHDALWRYHYRTPGKGMIGIFNRSHYEEVLVVRVKQLVDKPVWKRRYDEINDFERLLANHRTRILKFFLNISRDEQGERLQARLDDPEKHWKFAAGDLADRALWDDYGAAFEDAINNCASLRAPWFIVPANRKWYRNLVVARTIADAIEDMNPQHPPEEPGLDDIVIPM